jgi:hypothetical protein
MDVKFRFCVAGGKAEFLAYVHRIVRDDDALVTMCTAALRIVATSTRLPSAAHVALLFDFLDGEEHALGRHRRIETNREFVIGDTADSPSY